MQLSLEFEAAPILPRLRAQLLTLFGPQTPTRRLDPLSQLIKAILNTRTFDAVAWATFQKLREACPDWDALGDMTPLEIEALIAPVTHADAKARQLPILIRVLRGRPRGLDLSFLAEHPVGEAMRWLRELPGVGPTVAAATLNFSTLSMRAFVIDTHTHRVLRRLGVVGRKSDAAEAYEHIASAIPAEWDAADLYEFHWLLKGLGQDTCTAQLALCGRCPLKSLCPRVDVAVRAPVVTLFPKT
ncbi:MAG TPA: endonuclease III [Caulobacteraceae bacterium]